MDIFSAITMTYWWWSKKRRVHSKKRLWVRPIFKVESRYTFGAGDCLIKEMRLNDVSKYKNFFRMGPTAFDELLSMVDQRLQKVDCRREPIPPKIRLGVTLRYLASGDSMTSLPYLFRLGVSTVSTIISETTEIIWDMLMTEVLKPPNEEQWNDIACGFKNLWNFPNCIGALDGKHVSIQAPPHAGSEFYNYKGRHSIHLLAIVDHQYIFSLVDIGAQGRQSDGGVFKQSNIGKGLAAKSLMIPPPKRISLDRPQLPHVFVADEAFALSEHLMKPYASRDTLDIEKIIFNYRLSRARRIVENAFGILVSRWRIFGNAIEGKIENIENVIKATICLHNFIMKKLHNATYITPNLVDREIEGVIVPGTWRNCSSNLQPMERSRCNDFSNNARVIRDQFKEYFNEEGAVPWQWEHL